MTLRIFTTTYHIGAIFFISPIFAFMAYWISKRHKRIGDTIFLLCSFLPIAFFLFLTNNFHPTKFTILKTRDLLPNINIMLATSEMGHVFTFIVSILHPIITMYAIAYFNTTQERNSEKTHLLIFISILFGVCLAYSSNLITAFVFYDLITISTYLLISQTETVQAREVANRYLTFLLTPSIVLLLPLIIIVYISTGTMLFDQNGILNSIPFSSYTINVLFAMTLFGTTKLAILPLYKWIVDAMIATAPVSAILHAVLVVNSGVVLLYKIMSSIFGIALLRDNLYHIGGLVWPLWILLGTILFGSVMAMDTDNLKKRLAYSTISNISYIALCLVTMLDVNRSKQIGELTLIAHSFAKINLFFYVGYLYARYNATNIDHLAVCKHGSYFISVSTIISIFSLVGLPFTIGHTAKHAILSLITMIDNGIIILAVISFATITSVIYLAPLLKNASLMRQKISSHKYYVHERRISKASHILFCLSMSLSAICIIVLYLFAPDKIFTMLKP